MVERRLIANTILQRKNILTFSHPRRLFSSLTITRIVLISWGGFLAYFLFCNIMFWLALHLVSTTCLFVCLNLVACVL